MQDIESTVRGFVVSTFLFGQDGGNLADTDSFLETGVVDSTGVLELVGFIEKTFRVEVEDEDMVPENLDSIRQVAEYVRRKLADSPAA